MGAEGFTFDFESEFDRRGKDALAVDAIGAQDGFGPGAPLEGVDVIPMWVADMNFPTAPSVTRAIIERAGHPLFGYFLASDAYLDAVIGWQERRHGAKGIEREHLSYHNGVLGGVASAIYAFTDPGESVLVNSPVYIGFKGTVANCGRSLEKSPLVRDTDGAWRFDFADMERRIEEKGIRLAILCSPHNPSGRVWERSELEQLEALFERHGVTVVADEIWSDIVYPGSVHVPFFTVGDYARKHTITLNAPSKTFNMAGLVGAYSIVFDEELRCAVDGKAASSAYNHMNVLSMHAAVGAYSDEGAAWVDELLRVLERNVALTCDFIDATDGIEAARPQGTYMVFVDCSDWCASRGKSLDELLRALWDRGVAVQDGRPFGGPCHIRMNLASPTHRIEEALRRMGEVLR